ncbi:MAG: DEAD/DEAH box helicase family protein [Anaerolineales bacterium]|jgi:superfamily II DNA or RNA helicase
MPDREEIERLISDAEKELTRLNAERAEIIARLQSLRREKRTLSKLGQQLPLKFQSSPVTNQSSEQEKIVLFKSLFRGREDVYPLRFESVKTGKTGYQPACGNEWISSVCYKPKIKCSECDNQDFLPIDETVLRNHLMGRDTSSSSSKDFTAGVYPLLLDNTCWFLAIDFDKESWQEDITAFMETCQMYDVPVALERSRSGNGGHAWIFFAEPIKAKTARDLGTLLLTKTMERRPEIGLASYDRLFPNQDILPQGGFGNLIALPLQNRPREKGNSVFIDEEFEPFQDQWAFLSSIRRMHGTEVEEIVGEEADSIDFIEIDHVLTEELSPWKLSPSRKKKSNKIAGTLPEKLELVFSDQLYLEKEALTPPLRNRLIRLAAFQNPEFYRAQAMRFSTFNIPRIISCAEDFPTHIGLPRGCFDDVTELLVSNGIKYEIADKRFTGDPLHLNFQGQLHAEQQIAADALLKEDIGVLSAVTAFGKTVVAIYLLAKRDAPTLILVHRRQLMDQWKAHLISFLGLSPKEIGQIGGGKRNPTGIVDIAMIQSLYKKGEVDDIVGKYGHVIVDECHHVSARSFELVVRRSKAKYVTGLSATIARKDGQHPIIFMQCGPVRHHIDPRSQATKRTFKHRVLIRKTNFKLSDDLAEEQQPKIHEIYQALMADDDRNALIASDILKAVEEKRFPIVLTERREHLNRLFELLQPTIQNTIIMKGGMRKRQREHVKALLTNIADDDPRIILATGRLIGEGFDDQQLDTLFLTLPISWRGTLTQYVGRLHREYTRKDEVIIYDYFDENVAMLGRMYQKRVRGYKALGYEIEE